MISDPKNSLVVSENRKLRTGTLALLGRDIRSRPEEIAARCCVTHRGISEDVATIAESIALADRLFTRHRATSWAREIEIEVPVFEIAHFTKPRVTEALLDTIHFLTGDSWQLNFVRRSGSPVTQSMLPFNPIEYQYSMPYSDGLDSFAQARLLEGATPTDNVVLKVRSARIGDDSEIVKRTVLRVPRRFGLGAKREQSYRTRPFVFYTFAGIGAYVARSEAVVIGESGQGTFGPAMIRYAGEWPFRSTHPGFVQRFSNYLSLALDQKIEFRQPQLWKTKGEVLRELHKRGLQSGWESTRSCSVRPNNCHEQRACGICGGCILRSLAVSSSDVENDPTSLAFQLYSEAAVSATGEPMSNAERHMFTRSIGTVVEFARLANSLDSKAEIEKQSIMIDNDQPQDAAMQIQSLILRHGREWSKVADKIPLHGWARNIVELV